MKILLTGISGQVGWELQRTLITLGDVISVNRNQLDLANPDSIRNVIREIKPDLIVNPAAYTAVDKAESEINLAMAINGVAPGIIAEEAKKLNAAIIHYSTDYVFDGTKNTPYQETDLTNPQNVYGKTKLAGEEAISSMGVNYIIFRTSWVYGLRGKNFLLTMEKLAKEREEIRVVDDQIGTPTWSRMIAEITAQIINKGNNNLTAFFANNGGIYNLSPSGKTSWYGFAKAIFNNEFSNNERKLKRLIPIHTSEYPTPASRPTFSLLDNQKIADTFSLKIPAWDQVLKLVIDS